MAENFLTAATARAREVAARAESVRAEARAAVTTWRWAAPGAELHRPEPFAWGYGPRRVRWLDEEQPGADRYGFDAAGRIVAAVIGGWVETFLRYAPDGVEIVGVDESSGRPDVRFIRLEDALPRYSIHVPSDDSVSWSAFERDERGLVTKIREHLELTFPDGSRGALDDEVFISYDALGRVREAVEVKPTGERETVYRARGSGPSARQLGNALEDALVECITEAIRANPPRVPVYVLLLQYSDDEPLPPSAWFAPTSHRDRVVGSDSSADSLYLLWNRAEFDAPCVLPLDRVPRHIRDLARELALVDEDGAVGRTVLQRASRRLNGLPWADLATVTDDFVVTCVGLEMHRFEEDLAASVPDRALVSRLRERGLLSR